MLAYLCSLYKLKTELGQSFILLLTDKQ